MSSEEFELTLLEEYLDAACDADDPEDLAHKITIYEKQLLSCKKQAFDFELPHFEASVYYLKARHKSLSEGFIEKTARSSYERSSGFDAIAPALLAGGQVKSRLREIISLLSQAIKINDNPAYRFWRADIYLSLKDKSSALLDVEHLLTTYGDDQEIYLEARKLKDEIEATKSSKCFVATAVYGSALAPEVVVFRQFRDSRLKNKTVGRWAISIYERFSPPLANWIATRPNVRSWIQRFVLKPALWLVRKYM